MAVTINCDIGESYGLYSFGNDQRIMPFITIANVACGVHASDPTVMHKTVRLALEHGVKVGAHPSLPDRQGFGRREMEMERDELRDLLIYQTGALKGFLEAEGTALTTSNRTARCCPSSKNLRQLGAFNKGGSGSSLVMI